MGLRTSAQLNAQLRREAIKRRMSLQLQDIYCMFDLTMDVVRQSKVFKSISEHPSSLNPPSQVKSSRILNLNSVMQQLLQSFKQKDAYVWGKEIHRLFKKHFQNKFQEMWPINKEQFYKIVLSNCKFETLDLQNQLEELASNMEIQKDLQSQPNRMSYERYFYEVGAVKIEQKLPSSFVSEDLPWQQGYMDKQKKEADFNINAINETIIKHEDEIINDKLSINEENIERQPHTDFLPLFINANSNKKRRITEKPNLSQTNKKELYDRHRVQNVSIISPDTVFYERLEQEKKTEISDLVKFYRQFSNTLEQMFFSSTSIISAPYKHFIYCLQQKMKRKNIKDLAAKNKSKKTPNKLLYAQTEEGHKFRQTRHSNNELLLQQIKEFAEAYTDFVWMFLQLSQIQQSRLGKLLNIYTLYGIVVKSIWKFVDWISDRGCQYQQYKIQSFYSLRPTPNNTNICIQKKKSLLKLLQTLKHEKNPQKYLKKIVVFYREASKVCQCADDLLNIYEQLMIHIIKTKQTKNIGLFRMPLIIQKLLKIEQVLSQSGEISYSWTTWCIVVEIMKEKIKAKQNVNILSRVQTEPDYEEYVLE